MFWPDSFSQLHATMWPSYTSFLFLFFIFPTLLFPISFFLVCLYYSFCFLSETHLLLKMLSLLKCPFTFYFSSVYDLHHSRRWKTPNFFFIGSFPFNLNPTKIPTQQTPKTQALNPFMHSLINANTKRMNPKIQKANHTYFFPKQVKNTRP